MKHIGSFEGPFTHYSWIISTIYVATGLSAATAQDRHDFDLNNSSLFLTAKEVMTIAINNNHAALRAAAATAMLDEVLEAL